MQVAHALAQLDGAEWRAPSPHGLARAGSAVLVVPHDLANGYA
ncbi:hypothetical protein [Crenalkalicoccus roseus]|nr:hypothetical protein [Crenalkalicoccus roseus]